MPDENPFQPIVPSTGQLMMPDHSLVTPNNLPPLVMPADGGPVVTPFAATWPARTWTAGELVTANMMNSIRDNLNDLNSRSSEVIKIGTGGDPGDTNQLPIDPTKRVHYVLFYQSVNRLFSGTTMPGAEGDRLIVMSGNTAIMYLQHYKTSLSAAPLYNRISSPPLGVPINGGWIGFSEYVWVGGVWLQLGYDQGGTINIPFSAGNFTTDTGGTTWVVASGNIGFLAYTLRSQLAHCYVSISGATITGSPNRLIVGGWPFTMFSSHWISAGIGAPTTGPAGASYVPLVATTSGTQLLLYPAQLIYTWTPSAGGMGMNFDLLVAIT